MLIYESLIFPLYLIAIGSYFMFLLFGLVFKNCSKIVKLIDLENGIVFIKEHIVQKKKSSFWF